MARAFAKFWKDLDALGLTKDHKACALYCHFLCVASVTARCVAYNACTVDVQPGQLVTSRSELSALLGLSDKEVRRAIKTLEKLQLVGQQGANKYTLITLLDSAVCEEEGPTKGQQKGQERASKGPAGGPTKGQPLYKEEERENRERENGDFNSASGDAPEARPKPRRTSVLSGWKLETFNAFWKAYGWMKGRGGAEKAWAAIPNLDKALVARICEAARKEAAQRQAILDAGRTPKWAQGWLNERRWEDDYTEQPAQAHRPYIPQNRQGQLAGMTWGEIRNEKNKQACRNAVREYLAEKDIEMEEEKYEQPDDEPWTVTVDEGLC